MPALLARHGVHDFETWRQDLSEEASTRRAHGVRRAHQVGNSENASAAWPLSKWDDLFRTQLFVKSDDLRIALARTGVIGQPEYGYLGDTESAD